MLLMMTRTWENRTTPTMPHPLPDSESHPPVCVLLRDCLSVRLPAVLPGYQACPSIGASNASCPSNFNLLCVQQSHVPVRSSHQSGGCNRWCTMKEQKLQPVRVQHAAQTYWQLRDCIANSLFNEVCNITGHQTQIKWLERLDVFFSRASAHVTICVTRHLLYTQIASSKSGG